MRSFVRRNFGLWGTLSLHRHALGLDLLRAPINVALAPIFLLTRIAGWFARLARLTELAGWLATRQIILTTSVSAKVESRVQAFIEDLVDRGFQSPAPQRATQFAIKDYVSVRNAMAEITTTCIVLICGYLIFRTATPGIISMASPVAEMQAHQRAVDNFWLGQRLGSAYYGVFSTKLSASQVIVTGVILAMIASLITTFAGIVADPLQMLTGTHRRRLHRLLGRLDAASDEANGVATEHIAARGADIVDIVLNIWRGLRG